LHLNRIFNLRLLLITLVALGVCAAPVHAQQLSSTNPTLIFPDSSDTTNPYKPQFFTLFASNGANVPFTYNVATSSGGNWLSAQPTQNTTSSPIQVSVNTTGLPVGTYLGTITFSASGFSSFTENVQLTIGTGGGGTGLFNLSQVSIPLSYTIGGSSPSTVVSFNSASSLTYTAQAFTQSGGSWLSVTPNQVGPTTSGSLFITTNPFGLSVGTYTGTVQVSAGGTTQNITVTLNVNTTGGGGSFTLSTTSIPFNYTIGGNAPTQTVAFNAASALNYTATATTQSGGNWLLVSPNSGGPTTSSSLFVYTNPAGLSAGTYTGTVQVSAGGSTQNINVTLTVGGSGGTGSFTLSPNQLTLNGASGGSSAQQFVTVTSNTGSQLSWTAFVTQGTFLSVSPQTGTTPGGFTVTASPAALANGTYTGVIQVTAGGQQQNLNVTFTVGTGGGGTGSVSFLPNAALNFSYQAGGSLPSAQSPQVVSASSVFFTTSATTSSGGNWLTVTPQSGSLNNSAQQLSVSVNPASLAAGTYSGAVQVFVNGQLANSLPVTLTVSGTGGGTGGLVSVAPSSVTFNVATGTTALQQQTLSLNTTTASSYSVSAVSNGNWLFVQPNSGVTNPFASLQVFANPSGLTAGTYTGTLTFTVPNQPQVVVGVTMFIGTGGGTSGLTANPSTLSFSMQPGGSFPQNQTIEISTPTSTTFQVTATGTANNVTWLAAGPNSGQTLTTVSGQPARATIAIGVISNQLPVGNYTGAITINATGLAPVSVPINLAVGTTTSGTGSLNPNQITFTYQSGGSLPQPRLVTIGTPTGQAATFTATAIPQSGANWLFANPVSGTAPGSMVVAVNPTALSPGTYSGTVNVSVSGSSSAYSLPVNLIVSGSATLRVNIPSANFNYQIGGVPPAGQGQNVEVTASNGGSVPFTAIAQTTTGSSWLTISNSSASTPSTLSIGVNASNLTPGTYTGTVSFTASGQSAVVVPVTLTVSNSPLFNANPSSITFTSGVGGTPAPQSVQLSTTSPSAVLFNATTVVNTTSNWLSASVNSSQTPASINVSVIPVNLAEGTYSGAVIVNTPSTGTTGNAPFVIPVLYIVGSGGTPGGGPGSGTIAVAPSSLTFTQIQGGGSTPVQSVNISSGGAFNYSVSATTQNGANWLQVTPTGGSTPATISVSTNNAGLGLGTYGGSIIVTAPGATNSPQIIPVTMNVVSAPTVTASPTSLAFSSGTIGVAPGAQTITLSTSGASLNYTASSTVTSGGVNWLEVTPTSGTLPGSLTVRPNVSGLQAGTYSGTVTINAGLANPITIPVSFSYGTGASSGTRILPQFAFGGGWSSALYFANTSDQAVTVQVQFISDSGAPLFVPSIGATSRTLTLTPRGSGIIEAPNSGNLTQGYVSVTMPDTVTGYGVFRQVAEGRGEQEAVVPFSSATATRNTLIFDDNGFTTSVAVVNPSISAANITIVVRDTFGTQIGTSSVQLPAGGKTAFVLRNAPGLNTVAGQRGVAEFTSTSGNVAVLGLRFGGQAFTSIPTSDR